MKRLFLFSTAFAALALSACDSPTEPTAERRAFAVVENASFPVTFSTANPCTGEPVNLNGTMHVKFAGTLDGNGGIHTLEFSMTNFKGVGITLTGGTVNYVGQNGFKLLVNDPGNPAFETTQHMSDRMVRQGEDHTLTDDDFVMLIVVHLTVNGNGVPTSLFLHDSKAECR